MKLAIISHTEHYKNSDGETLGFDPTVREINHLSRIFDEIFHVAPLHETACPANSGPYENDRIHFIPIRPSGGVSLSSKLETLWRAPSVIKTMGKALKNCDVFQLRAPTGMAVYLLPWLTFFDKTPGWVKYAGNWNQSSPPIGYAFQRWWLKKDFLRRPVTINGNWPQQPRHCYSFENPCLEESDRVEGYSLTKRKNYSGKLQLCFAGRLEDAKGVGLILEALSRIRDTSKIQGFHFIGDGEKRLHYEKKASAIPISIHFHGFLSRADITKFFSESHLLLLPSFASEGFPKVIAEAANYGCIPIVSNVSCIGQYITEKNGFVFDNNACDSDRLAETLHTAVTCRVLKELAMEAHKVGEYFTFSRYNRKIRDQVCREALGIVH